jgi:transcriptional regulator with XRE-family HTH domain
MPVTSEHQFSQRLATLRREDGLTFRALADRLRETATPGERSLSQSYLVMLEAGTCRPTPEVIKAVCRAFDGVQPESFVEWRLWQVQRLFDPEGPGGFEGAIAELDAFSAARLQNRRRPDDSPAPRGQRRRVRAAAA